MIVNFHSQKSHVRLSQGCLSDVIRRHQLSAHLWSKQYCLKAVTPVIKRQHCLNLTLIYECSGQPTVYTKCYISAIWFDIKFIFITLFCFVHRERCFFWQNIHVFCMYVIYWPCLFPLIVGQCQPRKVWKYGFEIFTTVIRVTIMKRISYLTIISIESVSRLALISNIFCNQVNTVAILDECSPLKMK